jgi:Sulfotransferase family
MRPPVLIIGAHRSGTSATARALEILGLQIGHRLDSHREPKALQQLHEEYLKRVGAAWHNPGPFIESIRTTEGEQRCVDYLRENMERNFAGILGYRKNPRGLWLLGRLKFGAPWGWKEPRTTLFVSAWRQVFPGARIVHVLRDPLAAASSIRERERRFQAAGDSPSGKLDDLDYCLNVVQSYVATGERLAGGEDYFRVAFEDIQTNPGKTLEQTARFCRLRFSARQLAEAATTIRPATVGSTFR